MAPFFCGDVGVKNHDLKNEKNICFTHKFALKTGPDPFSRKALSYTFAAMRSAYTFDVQVCRASML